MGGQASRQAAGVIGTNQRRKPDRRAKRGRRGDDGPVPSFAYFRDYGPVYRAAYASVGETGWLREITKMTSVPTANRVYSDDAGKNPYDRIYLEKFDHIFVQKMNLTQSFREPVFTSTCESKL